MKKMLLIINPRAGKMRVKSKLFDVLDVFCDAGFKVTVQITKSAGHGVELAKNSGEYDIVVCSGGDGTLNEIISGVMESGLEKPIGYIPSGSTNDFAKSMVISSDIKEAASSIAKGEQKKIDIGILNNSRYFTYIASFGMFTSASYNTPQSAKNIFGHLAYVFQGMKDLRKLKSFEVRAETGDAVYEGTYVFGGIANSTSVGGMVNIDKHIVDLSDGLFEVLLIKQPKSLDELAKIINGIATSNFKENVFDFFKASEIKFTMHDNVSWSLDGEEYSPGTEVTVKNLKQAIKFVK